MAQTGQFTWILENDEAYIEKYRDEKSQKFIYK